MRKDIPKIIIILPCYNEEEIIQDSINKIFNEFSNLKQKKLCSDDSYIMFVDDGSSDNTWKILKSNLTNFISLKAIKLTYNCGHQNAIMAGINEVKNDCDLAITIDSDLQDDITKMSNMISLYMKGSNIICGVKKTRNFDKYSKRLFSNFFYNVMKIFGIKLIKNHADFRLMSSKYLHQLSLFNENNLFIRGIIPIIDKNYKIIEYDLLPRKKSLPKYKFTHSLSLGLSALTSFSLFPLRLISITGLLIFLLSAVLAINAFYKKMIGITLPGWASITIPLYAIGGILILSIGIVGEYIGKIFLEVKKRPKYTISEKI